MRRHADQIFSRSSRVAESMGLAERCHDVAKRLPRDEQPILGYQVRKSALSLPSNVAEGFARHSTAFYVQHLWTAHALGAELQSQLELGQRIKVVTARDAEMLIGDAEEIGRMLYGLVASLERGRRVRRSPRSFRCPRLGLLRPSALIPGPALGPEP
jgi:four helix bundle protein